MTEYTKIQNDIIKLIDCRLEHILQAARNIKYDDDTTTIIEESCFTIIEQAKHIRDYINCYKQLQDIECTIN